MLNPHLYVRGNQLQTVFGAELIPKYIDLIQWRCSEELKVLDIGCGSGEITWNILRPQLPSGTRIYGCDISKDMVSYIKEKYSDVYSFCLDIGTATIPSNLYSNFDSLFSFFCLQFVQNQRQAMENMYKMLKPEGSVFMYYLAKSSNSEGFYKTAKLNKWKPYIPDNDTEKHLFAFQHMTYSAVEKYIKSILVDIGFKIKLYEVITKQYKYHSIEEFRNFISAVNPHSSLPSDLKEEFIDDALKECIKLLSDEEKQFIHKGEINRRYKVIIVIATK